MKKFIYLLGMEFLENVNAHKDASTLRTSIVLISPREIKEVPIFEVIGCLTRNKFLETQAVGKWLKVLGPFTNVFFIQISSYPFVDEKFIMGTINEDIEVHLKSFTQSSS